MAGMNLGIALAHKQGIFLDLEKCREGRFEIDCLHVYQILRRSQSVK
jgi:hypothetical protein